MKRPIVSSLPKPAPSKPARRCAFIAGDGPFHGHNPFCDAAAMPDSSYCGAHHALCYMPAKKRVDPHKRSKLHDPDGQGSMAPVETVKGAATTS